jgi:hypothetical protein
VPEFDRDDVREVIKRGAPWEHRESLRSEFGRENLLC